MSNKTMKSLMILFVVRSLNCLNVQLPWRIWGMHLYNDTKMTPTWNCLWQDTDLVLIYCLNNYCLLSRFFWTSIESPKPMTQHWWKRQLSPQPLSPRFSKLIQKRFRSINCTAGQRQMCIFWNEKLFGNVMYETLSQVQTNASDLPSCGICDVTFLGVQDPFIPSTTCSGPQIREDTVASPSQAELSDNRWDLECLPVLSKQEECVHACMCCSVYCIWWRTPAGRVLPTPYETCWRMITMESDYHLVSHLSLCPLPLPPPLFCFSLLSHSAREVKCHPVSVVKAANHPHSECKATVAKETVIRLLGTWSCAHNSHFVAWKHTYMHART